MWMPQLATSSGPKYLAIADALSQDIASGRLRPGDRLPPQRQLADALNLDLTTVTRAFGEAQRRGLIDARAGRGSFVRTLGGQAAPPAPLLVDMSMNMPPQPPQARLRERIASGIAALMDSPDILAQLHYQDSAGIAGHRQIAAGWLARRLGRLAAERVLVLGGAQSALSAVAGLLLKPGDAICAGELTYPGLKAVAEQRGVRILPLAMDGEGIMPDAFEAACRTSLPKLLYCVPTIDNPTTATMGLERRQAIAAIARRHGVPIVEDDPYGLLPEAAPAPFAALAPEIGWHIASLSKCATPALRIAYVVTPGLPETLRLSSEVRAASLMASPLMSALAARWIGDGTMDEIVAAIRAENRLRQSLATRILGEAALSAPDGPHLWLRLPAHWSRSSFVAHALHSGLALVSSDAFATGAQPPEAVRVSLGVVPDRQQLERALHMLAGLLNRRAASTLVV